MRKKWDEQLSIWHYLPKNRVSRELRGISEILEANAKILEGTGSSFGNPAIHKIRSAGPVAFRPPVTRSLALSMISG